MLRICSRGHPMLPGNISTSLEPAGSVRGILVAAGWRDRSSIRACGSRPPGAIEAGAGRAGLRAGVGEVPGASRRAGLQVSWASRPLWRMEVARPRGQGLSREEVTVGRPSRPGVQPAGKPKSCSPRTCFSFLYFFDYLLFVDEAASIAPNLCRPRSYPGGHIPDRSDPCSPSTIPRVGIYILDPFL
jgi:hypothetical protein